MLGSWQTLQLCVIIYFPNWNIVIAWPVDFVIERIKGDMQRPLVMLGVTNSKAWDAIQEDESTGSFSLRKKKAKIDNNIEV